MDETSMLDINLGLALLQALPCSKWRPTHLVLVGERHYLSCCGLKGPPPALGMCQTLVCCLWTQGRL